MQGRFHGAPRAHRAVHDRRVHEPDGGRPLGGPRAFGRHGRQPDLLHVSGAEPAAGAQRRRPDGAVLARVLLARRAGHVRLRPAGDRDSRLRVAHAAGLARRPDGPWPGPLGLIRKLTVHARLRFFSTRATTFTGFFFAVLTASRLFFSASIRLTTFGGASTAGDTTSSPAIFASMIR